MMSATAGLAMSLLPGCGQTRNFTQSNAAPPVAGSAPEPDIAIPEPLAKQPASTEDRERKPAAVGAVSKPEPVPAQVASRDLKPPPPVAVATIQEPTETTTAKPAVVQPSAPTKEVRLIEDRLVSALRCYLNKRPDEAINWLKDYDKTTQELLLVLLPLAARLTEGGLQTNNPQEMKITVEQFEDIIKILSSKAPFSAEHMCFCRTVKEFGSYKKIPGEQVFHPDDRVDVYVEFKNFSTVWNGQNHCIRLASRIEIRDYGKHFCWEPSSPLRNDPDFSSTPRHDYHRVYSLTIPHIPPGSYTLLLHVTDLPTGRSTEVTADFQVAPARGL
jgi:hypothetical protein